ncbi:uncharacterized protein LOC119126082 isoform X2 [Syngnathus acus]|uniref:uncharacterized protein LOC119126082 isoform X2 n=1 Tax=Syngnathus acus TaxID=161584 RepID=UPI0018864492|nr:uncharacterized protein LOC119126082 isoform X2 [Syngnathus acus]
MNAAKAKLEVYKQEQGSTSDLLDLFKDYKPKRERLTFDSKPAVTPQLITRMQSSITTPKEDSTTDFAKVLAESFSVSRLPAPEPAVFSGDPLKYKGWKMSFQTLIGRKNIPANEKIYYLQKYVGGPARKAIEGYFLLGTDAAYQTALDVLEKRYGSSFMVAKAFRDKLASWPNIGPKESIQLREFSDFLQGCQAAMSQIKSLEVLNDCGENQRMLSKLPDWLTARWNRRVTRMEKENETFPSFDQFVEFVTEEADIACNPITSLHALKSGDGGKEKPQKTRSVGAKVLASSSEEKTDAKGCVFCEKSNHGLQTCRKFLKETTAERVKFVKTNKLCFGCLKSGHQSKNCEKRSICETCKRKHPTCLHENRPREDDRKEQEDGERKESGRRFKKKEDLSESEEKEETPVEATANRVVQDKRSTYSSTVVPVWLSTASNPEQEVRVYALLDNQSDTTFILQETAEVLVTEKQPVQLKLSTMSSKDTVIQSQKLTGLQVRGYNETRKISLPVTYTREFIPANLSHVPIPETARSWPHLEHLAGEITPLCDCEIGLLIGYNCSQALLPREVVSGKDNEPFAQRTDLGWSIVGCADPCVDYGDAIGSSHRIVVKQVITPPEVIKALESDFNERIAEDAHISQEDLRFLSIMEEGIKAKPDGRCEMPLPFKEERPSLPQNRICADHRLKCLRKRLERDEQYRKDYKTFMSEMIARGDAEKVTEEQLDKSPSWYIPHHGVYHPHKPGKIRVVFDCSAKYQGMSLNDHLLTGPELTNTLVGVLCRFRKGPVAIMCDVERMFHQFHVRPEDRDYLRFLWWEDGDLQSEPAVYRMKVHLFGAASSPGCANYGLKHIAAQGQGHFKETSIRFIERNFYVDDGLTSVTTEEEAIQLVAEAREICSNGKLRIHKFISNRQKVLASIPKEECAEIVRNQDLAKGEPQIERALGVEWCVASDQFQFRVVVKERPLSRRGVLSMVASIFDPLGFVAPFILVGKQILQQMCRDKIGWDEPLPADLRPQWESWFLDLQNLADIKIQRCYLPDSFKEVQRYELHHFSDASVTGYGECSYLRAIDTSGQIHCSLVMAKARVAPTKVTTVPRLELSAAVVAVRTSDLLKRELELEDAQEIFWTDSKVVLGYINNDARRFHVFVANRIQRIKNSTKPSQWRYVASEENPADHASRGLRAKELIESNWFTGPEFLWREELPSGDIKVGEMLAEDTEVRKAFVGKTLTTEDSLLDRFQKFSSWMMLVKAIARLKRRVKELKGLTERINEATSLEERKEAEITINDIVIIKDESTPRNEWKLAKVTQVYPSEDGHVRKIQLLISDSELNDTGKRVNKQTYLERPIHKTVTLLEAE